jgi:head-tail adaptor
MNPGLLDQRVRLERQAGEMDPLGQPDGAWALVVAVRARRLKEKASQAVVTDRDTETKRVTFRVRSRPFATSYQAGDRLMECARRDHPEATWRIHGVSEVEGTRGEFSDVNCESSP